MRTVITYKVGKVGYCRKTLFNNQFESNSSKEECDGHSNPVSSAVVNCKRSKRQTDYQQLKSKAIFHGYNAE